MILVGLTCLLAGILLGGMLVLALDIRSGEDWILERVCPLEPDGVKPPIGEEQLD